MRTNVLDKILRKSNKTSEIVETPKEIEPIYISERGLTKIFYDVLGDEKEIYGNKVLDIKDSIGKVKQKVNEINYKEKIRNHEETENLAGNSLKEWFLRSDMDSADINHIRLNYTNFVFAKNNLKKRIEYLGKDASIFSREVYNALERTYKHLNKSNK